MADDTLRDAHEAIRQAIAHLKAAGIAVPISLHRACHALSHALADQGEAQVIPFKPERRS